MKETLFKISKWCMTAFAVTWIGTFLYDKLRIPDLLETLLEVLSSMFSDSLDTAIGRAVNSSGFPYFRFMLFTLLAILSILSGVMLVAKKKKHEKKYWLNFIYLLFCLVITFPYFLLSISYYTIVPSIENHTEIVRPYISEKEYIFLRSEFFSINGYKDYQKVKEKIEDIMKANDLESSQVQQQPNN